jgi:hypothetical protein
MAREIQAGSQVKFREILEPGDDLFVFDVIEDNGERLLVRLVCDMAIRPTRVVNRDEVCIAQGDDA